MSESKLVLVERFEELKPGVRVVVRKCMYCGVDEPGMVIKVRPARYLYEDEMVAEVDPVPPCGAIALSPKTVALGLVWRWVDFDAEGERAAEATTTTRTRKKVDSG